MESSQSVVQLLEEVRGGDPAALNQLTELLYEELHRLARHHVRRQNRGHTVRTTDLVHEAYLKLANLRQPDWKDRIHFLSVASSAMRSVLVDYARRRGYAKRGQNPIRVSLAHLHTISEQPSAEVLAVDEALKRLSALDGRKGQIVELRYFGGLSLEETAEVMAISTSTVKREWDKAGAWLRLELGQGGQR